VKERRVGRGMDRENVSRHEGQGRRWRKRRRGGGKGKRGAKQEG